MTIPSLALVLACQFLRCCARYLLLLGHRVLPAGQCVDICKFGKIDFQMD